MEMIGWTIFGLVYIGPYVLVFAACCAALIVLAKVTFHVNRRLGHATLAAIAVGLGWLSYDYLWSGPATFRAACASGTGIRIVKTVKADAYALMYTPRSNDGLISNSDATFEQAILNVATKKVKFVELQDSLDPSYRYGLHGALAKFRRSGNETGYYKVFVTSRGSAQCRWLMPSGLNLPGDLKWEAGSTYRSYLAQDPNSKLNESLTVAAPGQECIAVDYVLSPREALINSRSIALR
jgi:hypothetical protein